MRSLLPSFVLTSLVLSAALARGGVAAADDPPVAADNSEAIDDPRPGDDAEKADKPLKERVRQRIEKRKERRPGDRDEGDWRRHFETQIRNIPGTNLQIDIEAVGAEETGEDGRPRARHSARIVIVGPDGVPRQFSVGDPEAPDVPLSRQTRYRVGVTIEPLPEVARVHLKLPAGRGIVVGRVFAGSPAEKAGLKQHDILLSADEKPLGSPEDLLQVLKERGTQPLTITFLREGAEQSVELTPVEVEEWDLPKMSERVTQQLQGQVQQLENQLENQLPSWAPRLKTLLRELESGNPFSLDLKSVGPGVVIEDGRELEGDPEADAPADAPAGRRRGAGRGTGTGSGPDAENERLNEKLEALTRQIEALQKSVDDLRTQEKQSDPNPQQ